MSDKVFVLLKADAYDREEIVGIFATKEDAESQPREGARYSVREYELGTKKYKWYPLIL